MDLTPTAEQSELITWTEELAESEFPLDRFASGGRTAVEAGVLKLAELGWLALGLPEDAGGSSLSVIEEVLLSRATGRWLPSPALVANVLAAHLAVGTGDSGLAREFTTFERRAVLVFPASGTAFASDGGDGFALDSDGADHFVIFDSARLSLMSSDGTNPSRVALGIDDSVVMDRVSIPASFVREGAGHSLIWLRAQLLISALLVGAGEGSLSMAVEYAKIREQFGRPIGSFQAIKHKCADVALQLASARSQLIFAAACLNEGVEDIVFQVAAARCLAGVAATTASYSNLQIHGGMGFTSECHAQRFVKRITLLNMLGGGVRAQREALLGDTSRAA